MNIVAIVNRFETLRAKYWTAKLCFHASKGPVLIMTQLKFIYNRPFKNLHLHPIHSFFPMIASNAGGLGCLVPYSFLRLPYTSISEEDI